MTRTIAAAAFILAAGLVYAQTGVPRARPTGTSSLPRARPTAPALPTGTGDIVPRVLPRMTPLEPPGGEGVPTGAPGGPMATTHRKILRPHAEEERGLS